MSKRRQANFSFKSKAVKKDDSEAEILYLAEIADLYTDSEDESIISFDSVLNIEISNSNETRSNDQQRSDSKEKIKTHLIVDLTKAMRNALCNQYEIIDVDADGSCFFRVISLAITDSENQHQLIRSLACDFIIENQKEYKEFFDQEDIEKWVIFGRERSLWADELVISATAVILDVTIEIFSPGYETPQRYNPGKALNIAVFNSNRNHFEYLKPKMENNLNKAHLQLQNPKKTEIPRNIMEIHESGLNIFRFPKDGKSCYEDIFAFLTNHKIPTRIQSMPKDSKEEERKMKKALSNFKQACSNYKVLSELELFSLSRLQFFSQKESKNYVVPYKNEIKGLVFDAHRSTSNHYDIKETKNKLKASGIFWNEKKNREGA